MNKNDSIDPIIYEIPGVRHVQQIDPNQFMISIESDYGTEYQQGYLDNLKHVMTVPSDSVFKIKGRVRCIKTQTSTINMYDGSQKIEHEFSNSEAVVSAIDIDGDNVAVALSGPTVQSVQEIHLFNHLQHMTVISKPELFNIGFGSTVTIKECVVCVSTSPRQISYFYTFN
jgi:hypothetical protein